MSYPGYPPSGGYPPQPPGPGYPSGGGLGFGPPAGYPPTPQQGGAWMPGGGAAPYPTSGSSPYPSGGPAPYPGGGSAPYPPSGGGNMPESFSGVPYPAPGGSTSAPYPGGGSSGPTPYPVSSGATSAPYPGGGGTSAPYPTPGSTPSSYPPPGSTPTSYPPPGQTSAPYPGPPQRQAPGGYMNAPPPVPTAITRGQSSHKKDVAQATAGVASMAVSTYKEPVTEGTVKPFSRFDAESDANTLRKAMKGFGTDEKAIINVVAHRSWQQRQDVMKKFKSVYGKDLIKELKSELSSHFKEVVISLFMKPREYDAYILRHAIKGAGTDENALIEVLCTRNNEEIREIKQQYKLDYSRDLEADVRSDTSGHFKKLLTSMLTGARDPNGPVDRAKAKADAQTLYDAGEGRWGTDESKFNQILAARSIAHLQVVFEEYAKKCKYDIEQSIDREMSGDLKDGMLAVVKCVRDKPGYFAEMLYKSMKGFGTDDSTLVRVMVSRCEVDMVQIKKKFHAKYYKTLGSFIKGDTSGDYKRILLALAGEDSLFPIY